MVIIYVFIDSCNLVLLLINFNGKSIVLEYIDYGFFIYFLVMMMSKIGKFKYYYKLFKNG